MSKLKVLLVNCGDEYKNFIKQIQSNVEFATIKEDSYTIYGYAIDNDVDLAVFGGGPDVGSRFYGGSGGTHTKVSNNRDTKDYSIYRTVTRYNLNTKLLGICRGAQFITAMMGGDIIQHVTNHTSDHEIEFETGEIIKSTSTHHQMMYPYSMNRDRYNILAWSRYYKSTTYLDRYDEERDLHDNFLEPEIVKYNVDGRESLCIQGHPEMSRAEDVFKEKCLELIRKNLL